MTLSTLFEKQVFIRLTEDRTALICTARWPLFTSISRVSVDEAGSNHAPAAVESSSVARSDGERL